MNEYLEITKTTGKLAMITTPKVIADKYSLPKKLTNSLQQYLDLTLAILTPQSLHHIML